MANPAAPSDLEQSFGRAARRIRLRLGLRRVLTGGAYGLCAGAVAAAAAWWLREGELRPWSAALALVGAGLGAALAARARWSDREVALFLDERLGSREQIVTALELKGSDSDPARLLQRSATDALTRSRGVALGPKVLDAPMLVAPFGAAAIIWLSLTPLPPAPPVAHAPGAERIQRGDVKGLERIEALRDQRGLSPEDEKRLRALAEEAKKLRGELGQGIEKREALARMAKMRDAIAELRADFGGARQRPGLEAAIGALNEHPELRKAARALGDGDITAFDREMQRLANQAEKEARDSAKEALEEAERKAREKGAQALADALKEQRNAFEKNEAGAEALRQLAESLRSELSPEALEDLKEFGSSGDPEAGRRLAEAMGKALSQLTDEERQRLAEQLRKRVAESPSGAGQPMTREELEALAKRLASKEGLNELKEQLKELASPDASRDAQRDGALDDAERGLGEAERGLGGMPMPMPGGAPAGGDGSKSGPEANAPGSGTGRDGGKGTHDGESQKVEAPELRAKANAQRNAQGPMHAATLGRAPARPGDTANQRGTGALGSAAAGEIGAVEQSEVPEEYREHVGRYFEP